MSDLEGPHHLRVVAAFDAKVDQVFEHLRGREPSDRIWYALSELGDFSLVWHLAGWSRALVDEEELGSALRLSACLALESLLVNGVLKSFFERERPVDQGERPHRLRIPLTTSFPSGHASSAMLAASILSRGRGGKLWWLLAGGVAASRVHVRIHHASDVVGGAVVGLALGAVARRIWRRA